MCMVHGIIKHNLYYTDVELLNHSISDGEECPINLWWPLLRRGFMDHYLPIEQLDEADNCIARRLNLSRESFVGKETNCSASFIWRGEIKYDRKCSRDKFFILLSIQWNSPEMRTAPLIRTPCMVPATYKTTLSCPQGCLEWRGSTVIRTMP